MKLICLFMLSCLIFLPGCKQHQRLALPPEERFENKEAVARNKISESEKVIAKEEFLIPLDEEPEIIHQETPQEKEKITQPNGASEQSAASPDEQKKESGTTRAHKKKHLQHTVPHKLDFSVENNTGRTIYVTCFSYIKKRIFSRWRWDKSPVYMLKPQESVLVAIDYIPDPLDRKNVYGYLGVFQTEEEAEAATYELTEESRLLDLDLLKNLYGKKVTIEIEKYGLTRELLEYDFVKKKSKARLKPRELDFLVENQTGKTVHVIGFIYEKKAKGSWFGALDEKDDMSIWRYDKTPILTLADQEQGYVDVDSLYQGRDRLWARGFIAVFDEQERELAEQATYELVEPWRKLRLDRLEKLFDKKIVLGIEAYGLDEDFIDYIIKKPQSALKKLERSNEH